MSFRISPRITARCITKGSIWGMIYVVGKNRGPPTQEYGSYHISLFFSYSLILTVIHRILLDCNLSYLQGSPHHGFAKVLRMVPLAIKHLSLRYPSPCHQVHWLIPLVWQRAHKKLCQGWESWALISPRFYQFFLVLSGTNFRFLIPKRPHTSLLLPA